MDKSGFVGTKMLLAYFGFKIPIVISLIIIVSILAMSVLASVVIKPSENK